MEPLRNLLKGLFTYCTDFIINLANILELSYYEVNFLIFILLYPLFILVAITIFIFQKIRLRKLKIITAPLENTSNLHSVKINSFSINNIYLYSNLAWILMIGVETLRVYTESLTYFSNFQIKGVRPQEADNIMIPLFEDSIFVLFVLLTFINLLIFLTTRTGNLPSPVFCLPTKYNLFLIIWEIIIVISIILDLVLFSYLIGIEFYLQAFIILFFGYIFLNIRAGQINKIRNG